MKGLGGAGGRQPAAHGKAIQLATGIGDHAAKYGIILQRYTLGCWTPAL